MLFLPLVLLPAIRSEPNRIELLFRTGIKFRLYGWLALAALLITGLLNIRFRGIPFSVDYLVSYPYGNLIGYKLVIFLIILTISGIHDFYLGERAITQMRQGNEHIGKIASWSGRINLLMAFIAAFIGIVLSRGGV